MSTTEVITMSKVINVAVATSIFADEGLEFVNEELKARGQPEQADVNIGATILASQTRSLDEFAATMVNLTHGSITGKALTPLMAAAFPDHGISDRHGPHYISSARTTGKGGKVAVRYAPVSARANARPAPTTVVEPPKPFRVDLSDLDPKVLAKVRKLLPADSALNVFIGLCEEAMAPIAPEIQPEAVTEKPEGLQNDVTVA